MEFSKFQISFLQSVYGELNKPELIILICSAILTLLITLYFTLLNNDDERPVSFTIPLPEQCKPGWKGEVLDGPKIKISGSSAIQCYCPANGRLLGLVNAITPDGIDRAISKAQAAQVAWAKTTFSQRRKVLRTLLKYVIENQDLIATIACLDSGKTKVDACLGEILVTAERLKWTLEHGEKALKPEPRPTNFLMMYKQNEVRWEPLGVVAACLSGSRFSAGCIPDPSAKCIHQFHNVMGPIISALFTGSAIVVKASEQTAWSLAPIVSIARNALSACGHSPNLVQPIVCWPLAAEHLISHPSIAHITFIGSRPVAHAVCTSAAKSLTPVCVELGGKDPAIILDDVHTSKRLFEITSILLRGVFISAGQNCVGIERIIALPKNYASLIPILESRIRSLRLGSTLDDENEVDVGAMISSASFDRLERLVADAVNQGAKCLVGGSRYFHPRHPMGHYFSPTFLIDVTPQMRIAQEEAFAPICVLMCADSVDHAIEIANTTSYALGASVFGTGKADLEKIIKSVKAGMVSVNDFAVYYVVQLPFGGVGGSGYGRFAGEEGLRGLCNTKSICQDRWPGVRTQIPARLDYPIKNAVKAWKFCSGLVHIGYATGWQRIEGLRRLISNK